MRYYVNQNPQPNGDHEVHTATCSFLPLEHNRSYLGNFDTCGPAVREGEAHLPAEQRLLLLLERLPHGLKPAERSLEVSPVLVRGRIFLLR